MKKIKGWIIDYLYLARGIVIMYWYSTPPKHYLGYTIKNRCPVIIIPGIALRWGFMKPLADFISLKGYATYVIPQLGQNLSEVADCAKKLEALIIEQNLKDVVIIGHSKGGLIGKYLLSTSINKKIKGLIAIATPFSGTLLSKFIPHNSYKELNQESKLIKELSSLKEINKKIISIFPEYDNHIWGGTSSFLEGAFENIKIPIRGHHKIINDKYTWGIILESIETFFQS